MFTEVAPEFNRADTLRIRMAAWLPSLWPSCRREEVKSALSPLLTPMLWRNE